jgi:hypothetical protein
MFNSQDIQNNWPQIKTAVLNKWNKLSDADIEQTHGNPNSLNELVNSKYGNISDFDKTYEKICQSIVPSSKTKNDIESRSATAPSAEAGTPSSSTESKDNTIHSGSAERKVNANFAEVENINNFSHETDDELSAYSPVNASRTSKEVSESDSEDDSEFLKLDNNETNTQFTAPDEFTPSQDPSPSREDITLGRNTSSATKISTAKAAPNSSEASNDAKKKI